MEVFGRIIARAWIRNARITEVDYYLKTDKTRNAAVNLSRLVSRENLLGKLCDVRITVFRLDNGHTLFSADARLKLER